MAKIKHIALSTQDPEKIVRFYVDVFGMKQIGRVNHPAVSGSFLSDGEINLAILNFKNDAVAGAERGKDYCGIHHIGFQVDSLEAIAERLAAAGSERRDDSTRLSASERPVSVTPTSRSSPAVRTGSCSTSLRPAGSGPRAFARRAQARLSRGSSRDAASSTWASWSPPAKRSAMWRAPASIQRWSHSTHPSIGPA